MGDEQYSAGKAAQQPFQPGDGIDIEVVGRLVEDEQLRVADQGTRQRDPLPLPAGQRLDLAVRLQSQLRDDRLDAVGSAPTIGDFQFVLQFRQPRGERVIGGQCSGDVMVFGDQRGKPAESCGHCVEHFVFGHEFRFLRHVADGHTGRAPQRSVVEPALTGNYFEQAALAAAVAPDQADALARFDDELHPIQQGNVAVGEMSVIEGDERHGSELSKQRTFYQCRESFQ